MKRSRSKVAKEFLEYLTRHIEETEYSEGDIISDEQFKKIEQEILGTQLTSGVRKAFCEALNIFLNKIWYDILASLHPQTKKILGGLKSLEGLIHKTDPTLFDLLRLEKVMSELKGSRIKAEELLKFKMPGKRTSTVLSSFIVALGSIYEGPPLNMKVTRSRQRILEDHPDEVIEKGIPGGKFFKLVKFLLHCVNADSLYSDKAIDDAIEEERKLVLKPLRD